MADTAVVTWNICDADADVERASTFVAALTGIIATSSVVALQEVSAPALLRMGSWQTVTHPSRGLVTLFDPAIWRQLARVDYQRALVCEAEHLDTGVKVRFVNLHLEAQGPTRAEGRETSARINVAAKLRERRGVAPHFADVVMGDFNFNPHDNLLLAQDGFYSNGHLRWAWTRRRKLEPVLFNPSWRIHGGRCGASGSFYRSTDLSGVGPWHIFDQILISPELADDGALDPDVVCVAGGVSLVKNTGTPDKSVASDHLPVRLNLLLQGAVTRRVGMGR